MKEKVLTITSGLLVLILMIGLAFVLELGGLQWKRFFGPKHQNVKREVWENTKSRVHGAVQEISKRRIEYMKSDDPAEKKAIASFIRSSYANLDPNQIDNYQVRQFFIKCVNGTY